MKKKSNITQKSLLAKYNKLAKEVNQMFSEIKKAGVKYTPAQQVLLSKIDTSNISKRRGDILLKPKKRNKASLLEAIKELEKYKTYRTATLKGCNEVENERISDLRNRYDELQDVSETDLRELLKFLGSEKGKNSKEIYDSDQMILALSVAKNKNKGKSFDELFNDITENYNTIADYLMEIDKQELNFIDL